jgi:hypothetical protein
MVADKIAINEQLPYPITPPDASKITVGPPDVDGYATVNGADGAVPGEAAVGLINLSSGTVMTATATASGAFTATLFAPPGSTLLVKYDLDGNAVSLLWQLATTKIADTIAEVNVLPGTTFLAGEVTPNNGEFQSVGFFPDWAGWWLSGTVAGPGGGGDFDLQPGDQLTVTGALQITTPELNCTGVPTYTPSVDMNLRYLFDSEGYSHPWSAGFISHLFTPTGLPIEHEADGERRFLASSPITDMNCLSQDTAQGALSMSVTLPTDLPNGVYRLEARIHDGGVPTNADVPRALIWHHLEPIAHLPPLTVGLPASPRIPWTILGNELSNGHRGANARQDAGQYTMLTRIVYPPETTVLPMLDERSGEPVVYRLEPGSPWLSSSDRRAPNPAFIPLALPGGELTVEVHKPDGNTVILGPATFQQSSIRTPTTPGGTFIDEGTGHICEIFHLTTLDETFTYSFDQYGPHAVHLSGFIEDIYGNTYPLDSTYDLMIARILDLDPAQLPTTPYEQGDAFAPGLHVFPPVPANVNVHVFHMPYSDLTGAISTTIAGQANRFGYFQPEAGTVFTMTTPGEFRVDITATYTAPDDTLWAGYVTWGNVVEGPSPLIEAHGRRGLDYEADLDPNDHSPAWFTVNNLPPHLLGLEIYYPYFSGDIHWGDETEGVSPGESIHPAVTVKDLTGANETIYNLLRSHYDRATNRFRPPPTDWELTGLNKRIAVNEAPLFITTQSGIDPAVDPDDIDLWGYWYGSSERPDVHVREIISEDGHGTGYWRFNDTYGYQIGEPANGDQPGDLKWEFGGVVLRTITDTNPLNEYAIYSSLWVLLPHNDPVGARVTPPFQDATGASINGGPIMTLLGEEIDMLFLPKGVRPGDILELGDAFAFSGHVGPPLNSRVSITVTSPSQNVITGAWHANKIGWLYDPSFDFPVEEPGRWTVEVSVTHDRPYPPIGVTPTDHNTGTVLGTHVYNNTYEFYVVSPDAPRLFITSPPPGFITWSNAMVEPIEILGLAPPGTTAVHYTIHDKGVVMGQGTANLEANGSFSFVYDAKSLHDQFPMLSLTAHEGNWEGLADEVAINFLAIGAGEPAGNTVTLIGEEVFIGGGVIRQLFLPGILKTSP